MNILAATLVAGGIFAPTITLTQPK